MLCRPQLCRVEGSEERYLAFFNTCTVHMLFMAAVPVLCAVGMWRQAEEAQISISFAYKGGVSRIIVPPLPARMLKQGWCPGVYLNSHAVLVRMWTAECLSSVGMQS